jgi:hypothetical protein
MVMDTDMGRTDTQKEGAMSIIHRRNCSTSSRTEGKVKMAIRMIITLLSPHAIGNGGGLRGQQRLSVGCDRRKVLVQRRGVKAPGRATAATIATARAVLHRVWVMTGTDRRPFSSTSLAVSIKVTFI